MSESKNHQKALKYEKEFSYSHGILNITPQSWYAFAWSFIRKQIVEYMEQLIENKTEQKILIVGVGVGDILPYVWKRKRVFKIGIDINKNFLLKSTRLCYSILASASDIPLRDDTIDVVFFDQVLHHIAGQGTLEKSIKDAHRVLIKNGKFVAMEPSSYNFSGFLLNLINTFHLYHTFFGGSNYEFALSPAKMRKMMLDLFRVVQIRGITFVHRRFPVSLQKFLLRIEKPFLEKIGDFAWYFRLVAIK